MKLKVLLSIFLVSLLASCSHIYGKNGAIKDRGLDYLDAESIPTMKLPPGYRNDLKENYPVPNTNYGNSSKTPSLIPPGLNSPGN